jgi:hypothetical protein
MKRRYKQSVVTDPKNNKECIALLKTRPDLNEFRLQTMMAVTGYKRASIHAWFAPRKRDGDDNPNFRPMPNVALRLFKLEIGVAEPRFLKNGL